MASKDWKKVVKAARDQGWTEKPVKKGLMLLPPDKTKPGVTVHKTPSDVRAIDNKIAEMRRSGFMWPWPPKGGK